MKLEELRANHKEQPWTSDTICTVCQLTDGSKNEAIYVATDGSGMQWFECEDHDSDEHAAALGETDGTRIRLEPITEWRRRIQAGIDPAGPDEGGVFVLDPELSTRPADDLELAGRAVGRLLRDLDAKEARLKSAAKAVLGKKVSFPMESGALEDKLGETD